MEKSDAQNYKVRLLSEMNSGQFACSNRLPRETELAEMLSISRTQLRDVLSELEREGYITRRHGVGTLINRHVLQVKNRMDIPFLAAVCAHPNASVIDITPENRDELFETLLPLIQNL